MRTFGAKSRIKNEKYPCYFCNKFFVNPSKHTPKCLKRFNILIGPLPELCTCPKCQNGIYRSRHYEYHLTSDKKIHVIEYYSFDEHVLLCSGGNGYNIDNFVKSKMIISIEEY